MSNSSTLSTGWAPPPVAWLNFTNCEAASSYLGGLAQAAMKHEPDQDIGEGFNITFSQVIPYMRSLVPSNWTTTYKPSQTDLIAWYMEFWTTDKPDDRASERAREQLTEFPQNNCGDQTCSALNWTGDSDVSGIGMVIAYYLAAALVTLYFIILAISILDTRRKIDSHLTSEGRHYRLKQSVSKVRDGFAESTGRFLETAQIFAMAMLAATIYRYASALRHFDKATSGYALISSLFMSAYSIFPPIVLQCVLPGMRENSLRQFLWFVIIVFEVTVVILFAILLRRKADAPSDEQYVLVNYADYLWIVDCNQNLDNDISKAFYTASGILSVNGLCWAMCTIAELLPRRVREWTERCRHWAMSTIAKFLPRRVKGWIEGRPRWMHWEQAKNPLRIFDAIVCGAMMWAFLGIFQRYRHRIGERTGQTDEDTQWTFGQVLSVATWASVGVDLLRICKDGLKQWLWPRGKVLDAEKSPDARSYANGKYRTSADQGIGSNGADALY